MRKLFVLVGMFVLASIVLAACQPAEPQTVEVIKTVVVEKQGEKVVETVVVEVTPEPAPTEEPCNNPYLGSCKLDGNGIPPDFFMDEHVRKAFNYCFDWDTFIADALNGEAVQNVGVLIPGMLGYDPNGAKYTYDPAKCEEEFKQAWDGQVWENGFRMQIAFNTGNDTRQTIAQILQQNISDINDKFQIEIVGLPWPAFLKGVRNSQFPIFISGWIEDIHDPHNWAQPFLVGTYASRQKMPDDVASQFADLVNQGVAATDSAERADIYAQIQQLDYEMAPAIRLAVPLGRHYEQKWVQGWFYNPIAPTFYYNLSKSADAPNPDTLTVATIGDSDTLDPAWNYESAGDAIIMNVYDTLVTYNKDKATEFVPQLAESWEVSDDGMTYTFHIRQGVKFHNGNDLTPEDVAYTFQRGLLQGGGWSPQWLFTEPFFGTGIYDIAELVDPSGALDDDKDALQAADADKLMAACQTVTDAITYDNEAGTVTMKLAQPWGPFLATLAQSWGSIIDKEWAIEQGTWDGDCATWQKYYGVDSDTTPLKAIENGTGPYMLDHWTPGEETVLVAFDDYWRTEEVGPAFDGGPTGAPAIKRVVIKSVDEWGTRFAMLQAGDADFAYVPLQYVSQVDPYLSEVCTYSIESAAFECAETDTPDQPLRLFKNMPNVSRTDAFFVFNITH